MYLLFNRDTARSEWLDKAEVEKIVLEKLKDGDVSIAF